MTDTSAPSASPELESATPVVGDAKDSKEVFLGGVVILVFCLLLLILAGTFGYFGYRLWQTSQTERSTPSIQELGEVAKEVNPTNVGETTSEGSATPVSTTAPSPEPALPDKATLEVKVLNGGGVKGSAGTLTELLKKAGYSKAAFGNTVSDYTGQTIYYGTDGLKAAEVLKEEIMKTYPNVTVAPAKTGDKDTTAALLVIILGK